MCANCLSDHAPALCQLYETLRYLTCPKLHPSATGASSVELYTALAYDGPALVPKMKQELAACLRRDGFKSVQEAVELTTGHDSRHDSWHCQLDRPHISSAGYRLQRRVSESASVTGDSGQAG